VRIFVLNAIHTLHIKPSYYAKVGMKVQYYFAKTGIRQMDMSIRKDLVKSERRTKVTILDVLHAISLKDRNFFSEVVK
jgi:hypothetical protein